ncbi:hypothetical protein BKA25_003358 [Actinoalloteichus hymeniacidonis]|uniref:Uncharacterized protein n=1 Tax=Actinoalloteichus hymeniacidonis TaxID=340345 RepID=A0AAC9MY54_9PSEU|nr:hypothetical protein TL08_10555 [Actinoalloteichus hymeniacidonis]MBB5909042.1 hypothetical protein [Actinoalloteichus hymeniacidonis]
MSGAPGPAGRSPRSSGIARRRFGSGGSAPGIGRRRRGGEASPEPCPALGCRSPPVSSAGRARRRPSWGAAAGGCLRRRGRSTSDAGPAAGSDGEPSGVGEWPNQSSPRRSSLTRPRQQAALRSFRASYGVGEDMARATGALPHRLPRVPRHGPSTGFATSVSSPRMMSVRRSSRREAGATPRCIEWRFRRRVEASPAHRRRSVHSTPASRASSPCRAGRRNRGQSCHEPR